MDRSAALLALLLVAPGCRGASPGTTHEAPPAPATAALSDHEWRTAATPDGRTTCSFRVLGGGELPRNQDFELEVVLRRAGEPLRGATLGVRGFMPDHGHGMVRRPRAVPTAEGTFVVQGMLLHMRGHWQLFFDIHEGGEVTSAAFDVEL